MDMMMVTLLTLVATAIGISVLLLMGGDDE
jgi:hypothetical protein